MNELFMQGLSNQLPCDTYRSVPIPRNGVFN